MWSGIDVFARQGLQFAVAVALARLLSPDEFGTIALLYLFTGLAAAFVDSGFSTALIRDPQVSHADESTVFWFNLAIAALMAATLAASAPLIARFFDKPVLVPLTIALALNVVLTALGSIHGTLLSKRLDFRTQFKVGAVAAVASGTAAVWLAWRGYGVWALAAQTLVASASTSLMYWVVHPWRPALTFRRDSARRLFGFGGFLLASSLLDIAYGRLYTILIGKLYGVRELGYFNRAESTKGLPVGVLTGILSRVALPVFSESAEDPARLRSGLQRALRGIMLVNIPVMLGIGAVADPLVRTLFGDEWAPSVPALQVLCLGGVFWPLHVLNLNVLLAQGHSRLFFRLEMIKKSVGLGLLAAGAVYGVMGIAWSQVVFNVVAFLLNSHYTRSHLGYGAAAQVRDVLPVAGVAIVMTICVVGLGGIVNMAPPLRLAVLVLAGAAVYLAVGWGFRVRAFQESAEAVLRRGGQAV